MFHAVIAVVFVIQGITGLLCDLYVLPDEVLFLAGKLHRKSEYLDILAWPLYVLGWFLWGFVRLVIFGIPLLLVWLFLQSAYEVAARKKTPPASPPAKIQSVHEEKDPPATF